MRCTLREKRVGDVISRWLVENHVCRLASSCGPCNSQAELQLSILEIEVQLRVLTQSLLCPCGDGLRVVVCPLFTNAPKSPQYSVLAILIMVCRSSSVLPYMLPTVQHSHNPLLGPLRPLLIEIPDPYCSRLLSSGEDTSRRSYTATDPSTHPTLMLSDHRHNASKQTPSSLLPGFPLPSDREIDLRSDFSVYLGSWKHSLVPASTPYGSNIPALKSHIFLWSSLRYVYMCSSDRDCLC
jgi:hypothetical protein